jgi:peptidoglycan-associated lipoprotein
MKKVVNVWVGMVMAAALLTGCKTTQPNEELNQQVLNGNDSMLWQEQQSQPVVTSGIGEDAAFPGENAGVANRETGIKNNTIYFSFDKSTVGEQYKQIIEANARYLKQHPNARVRLEGHTDPRGSREYNIGLGQRRADQVINQLLAQGVAKSELVVVSYGKEKLASMGTSDKDYALDRRVEVIYEVR